MNRADPLLVDLVERLAVMPPADRDAVLAELSEGECTKLLPLLAQRGRQSLSPALSELIRSCGANPPTGLAPRTAAALGRIAADARAERSAPLPPVRRGDRTRWSRFVGRWGGGS